jgi:hypothetical protein
MKRRMKLGKLPFSKEKCPSFPFLKYEKVNVTPVQKSNK